MMIPESKIEEILERTDIVALISRHVELKKSGRSHKGRCPFHNEKSPSFYVTAERRSFKCFGCQASGDAIAFVQRYLGKSFVDAVRDLAREVGVDLDTAEDPSQKERQQLREVTAFAHEHFKAKLLDPREGEKAREYLLSRGVPEEVWRAFGLGWAPLSWSELTDRFLKEGILEWAVKAGLVQPRQKGDGFYDTFRGRLVVPIRSPDGRTIAFGARLLLGEDGPKYLNSKESLLYNKSEVLFGMDQARDEIRRSQEAVLVEGYFDCIGVHQVGVKNAVALCSTALTPGHLQLLSRCGAKALVLLLDGDDAGRKAVERLAGALLAAGVATKVALLPEGEDPDTFARKEGVAGVRSLLEQARPLTQHLFATVLPHGKESSFEEKMLAVERVKPVAASLPVGLTRSAFFGAMASHFGLPMAELETTLKGKAPQVKPVPKPAAVPRPLTRPVTEAEAKFAAAVLKNPKLLEADLFHASDDLSNLGLRALVASASAGQHPDDALEALPQALRASLEAAGRRLPAGGPELAAAFAELCHRIKLDGIKQRRDDLIRATREAEAKGESETVQRLQEEFAELIAMRERLQKEMRPAFAGTNPPTEPV